MKIFFSDPIGGYYHQIMLTGTTVLILEERDFQSYPTKQHQLVSGNPKKNVALSPLMIDPTVAVALAAASDYPFTNLSYLLSSDDKYDTMKH